MDTKTMQARSHARNHDDLARAIAPHLAAILALLSPASECEHDLLPLADAARVACTSLRVLRDAIRAGELVPYGKQRDRSVRRSDLEAWINSRRVVHEAIDDRDVETRMRRIAGKR